MEENITQKRKEDARDLALLLYDIFKESQNNDTIENGQNNAQNNSNS